MKENQFNTHTFRMMAAQLSPLDRLEIIGVMAAQLSPLDRLEIIARVLFLYARSRWRCFLETRP